MKTFLARGSAALAVGALGFGLFASTASASGKDGPKPPKAVAVVEQLADNSNTTDQSSSASVANVQENWAMPVSLFTFDWSKFGAHPCDCDGKPAHGKPDHKKPDHKKPDHGKPGYSKPDHGKPCGCDGKPDHGKPDHGPGAPAGDVTQDNGATNEATSGTANVTEQGIAQIGSATASSDGADSQGHPYSSKPDHGKPCGCDGKPDHGKPDHQSGDAAAGVAQDAGNSNDTVQDSTATVDNDQSNVYVPVNILSPGAGGGDVSQGNEATNTASSGTVNETAQGIVQDGTAEATTESEGGYGHGGSGDAAAVVDQSAGNSNETDQTSSATVDNHQTNVYVPINVLSPGAGSGDVNQGNEATNTAESATVNGTDQGIAQGADATAGAAGGGDAVALVGQTAGNDNSTDQESAASVTNQQTNIAVPINVLSPGAGSGDIDQSNEASNSATSLTGNATTQGIAQLATAVATVTG